MSALPAAASKSPALSDADDLRGFHFKRLLRKPLTWLLIVGFTVVAGGLGVLFFGPVPGAVLAAIAFALGPITVFAIADAQSGDAFFAAYAKQHDLTLAARGPLPEATPLLRKGNDRFAERSLSGSLGDGVEGTIALYTYELEANDSKDDRSDCHRFTVGLVEIPESAGHVPELYCLSRAGSGPLEDVEDAFRDSGQRVTLESGALDKRCEIFAGKGQDENWLRQLFAPTFIVWLTDVAPDGFSFELVDGSLCCYLHGHAESTGALDTMRKATVAVASRLGDESKE
ncbi:MAG TPA: hypothetical protein VHU86_03285 [Solirubrobacterales bacterium]|nr:hypothetical protein [Solirubrobacterales bacterium]